MRPDVADFYNGISFDAYLLLGAHPAGCGWRFTLFAPHARRVQAVGDWNGWDLYRPTELAFCEDGLWRGHAPAARAGQLYKYNILGPDGVWRLRADPFALGFEALPGTAGRLVRPAHTFGDDDWMAVRRTRAHADPHAPCNIYEVHAATWRRHWDGRYYTFAELGAVLLPYLQRGHYTHVEFMPLAEYPFDGSWGYQGCGYFAPSARFGGVDDFCALVDALHQSGIGVLMDFVPVHFAPDAGRLACFDGAPLFEYPGDTARSDWGSLNFNLTSAPVRSFLLSSAAFWLHFCHCDGLRVDAIGNALYRAGAGRDAAAFFMTLSTGLHARCPGTLLIAEDTAGALNATAPTHAGGLGFDAVWDGAWVLDTLGYFCAPPQARPALFPRLCAHLRGGAGAVNALSHDENAWRTGTILRRLWGDWPQKFDQMRLLTLYQYARPGKKLHFMGNEFGNATAFDPYQELDWGALAAPAPAALADFCAALAWLYTAHPALHDDAGDFWPVAQDGGTGVLAFVRGSGGESLLCVFCMGGGGVQGYGLCLPPVFTRAVCLFAAGCLDDTPHGIANGWLTLDLPAFGGGVYLLQ